MDVENALLIVTCPKCGNEIHINKTWYPCGCNDYGVFVLKCDKCGHVFDQDIGRDVDSSDVVSGATLIEKKYRD